MKNVRGLDLVFLGLFGLLLFLQALSTSVEHDLRWGMYDAGVSQTNDRKEMAKQIHRLDRADADLQFYIDRLQDAAESGDKFKFVPTPCVRDSYIRGDQ